MFLTATATPSMVEKLNACLHDPCVWKGTVNHPNIILDVQEITDKGHVSKDSRGNYTGFANSVSKIIKKDNAIVYTDFIAYIAPITQALNELGITCAHYHGDLDAQSKLSSYRQWANGEVQVMVAAKAFGMGINNENVRHVIRSGVPPNINTCNGYRNLVGLDEMGRQPQQQFFTVNLMCKMCLAGFVTIFETE